MPRADENSIDLRAVRAATIPAEFESLFVQYKPFILVCVKKVTGANFVTESDDTASVAFIAFHEAVCAYRPDRGGFLAFAGTVIRNRLIDYLRQKNQHPDSTFAVSVESEDDPVSEEMGILRNAALRSYQQHIEQNGRKEEIVQLSQALSQWGITFTEMYKDAPKHDSTRKIAWRVVDLVLNDADIHNVVVQKKYLPVGKVSEILLLHRKKIEKLRRYIIGCILIADGDYPYLRGYLHVEMKP